VLRTDLRAGPNVAKISGVPPAPHDELTQREAEVLGAIERRLGNAEIAEELHVSVRTVESHIAALRRKLGVDSRTALISAARSRRGTTVQVPHNSFVGRDEEVARLRHLLEESRWVTVVGVAGAGKTRLALELATTDTRVPIVAELEHATSANVVATVAQAIGLAERPSDLIAACGMALAAQSYLLVLDNCDRVTEEVAPMIEQLLAFAPSSAVLATSRTPAGGPDETVFPLDPLPVEPGASTGATRLFVDRARAAAPNVSLSGPDIDVVERICERLDGLPLAIELAAARLRHLPLTELADRLDDGLGLLDGPGRSDRHRTLEAAFDWTWDMLDGDERLALSQLAALPKSFDLELAAAVVTPGSEPVVLRLLDRSLLAQTMTYSDPRRFRVLHSVREFVLGRTHPEVIRVARHAHAMHHASIIGDLAARARTDDSRELVDRAKRHLDEVSAALSWAVDESPRLATHLARSLSILLEQCGLDLDGLDAIALAARSPAVREVASATALDDIGIALCFGDLDLVDELATYVLGIADDADSQLAARHLAGFADTYRRRSAAALVHLQEAERLAEELEDTWRLASVRQAEGIALNDLGDPIAAMDHFESAMQTYAQAGDAMHVNNIRYMMSATAAASRYRAEEAVGWADGAMAYARATGNDHELAHATLAKAGLVPSADNVDVLHEVAAVFQRLGDLRCLTRSYLLMARQLSPDDQVGVLERALGAAVSAHDLAHQAVVLEQLVDAQWRSGAERDAALSLGHLVALVGDEEAINRGPDGLRDRVDEWRSAIAEGQARAR
jgi:predicted ATPase/DNA-binding CsgD family transcriptional regulator